MTHSVAQSHIQFISETIEKLRSCCQVNVLSSWLSKASDCTITDVTTSDLSDWQPVQLNAKGNIAWTGGKQVLWLVQRLTVPQSLQGYPLAGLSLRLALLWWADAVEVYVNGELVLAGDLFDCSPRVLLSGGVSPGDVFTVALRLVSPGHCEGALVRSLLVFESTDYNSPDPGLVADELAVVRLFLERFAPEGLAGLVEGVREFTNHVRVSVSKGEEKKEAKEEEGVDGWGRLLVGLREGFGGFYGESVRFKIYLLGHAHLDLAWLWRVSETWKAAQCTFESVLRLQGEFPELIFCHSTPALYAWIEENCPELFGEVQRAVAAGRWEVLGGFWVEPDLNLISGESIVRQLLYGQRYVKEKFGQVSSVVWVPDTFGFCATLPQFLVNAGVEYFVTQKLRWNDTTKFDYGAFWWRSPDGSEVFSLMSAPIGEGIDPVKMASYSLEWQAQTNLQASLWLPGVGDHGGGPTRDMLEIARRWQQSPFFPDLEFTTAQKYLDQIKEIASKTAEPAKEEGSKSGLELERSPSELKLSASEPETSPSELKLSTSEPEPSPSELKLSASEPETSPSELKLSASEHKPSSSEPETSSSEHETSPSEAQTSNSPLLTPVASTGGTPARRWLPCSPARPASPASPTPSTPAPHFPTWNDELYLEFHRGCYTTHADQKRWNRQCETLLYQAELFATLATVSCGATYPQAEIEAAWKQVLFHQFHDILPGSSITEVYQDALPLWEQVKQVGTRILQESLLAIASQFTPPQPPQPESLPIFVFNALNWQRSEVITLSLPTPATANREWRVYDTSGKQLLTQLSTPSTLLFLAPDIPPTGYRLFWLSPASPTSPTSPDFILENEYLRVVVDPDTGDLSSVFDKTQQREILSGAGNQLQAFKDSGQYWDAWNIDPNYTQHPLPVTNLKAIEWLEQGPVQNRLRVVRQLGDSEFQQDYILQTGSPLLKIVSKVNWQEQQVLVKAAFPLNLEADFATYEIPCGAIPRPTKPQTPAEKAKWEVPALRWADLTSQTEGNVYGVSLLNDCKYGYDSQPQQLRLTLLRSPNWPDPEADRGLHEFTYALYPHPGNWTSAHTVRRGYELNTPLQVLVNPPTQQTASSTVDAASFVDLSADNLILMALKPAEDNPQQLILRCYEAHGQTAELSLHSDLHLYIEDSVDLLERPLSITESSFTIQPWKIASFTVKVPND